MPKPKNPKARLEGIKIYLFMTLFLLKVTCTTPTDFRLPTVTTQAVTNITTTTATGNGNITSLGVLNPTAHGVCWNTTGTPTTGVGDSHTDEGAASSTGAFTSSMTSLNPNTTYYVRAYATNTGGTAYGAEVNFTTSTSAQPPHFETINGHKVLMVNDKPFLLLGVEGPVASGSNQADILDDLLWAANNNCNVYKADIPWRWIESYEDIYNWIFLDQIISTARANNIKIHLVYLGSNRAGGMTEPYIPDYMKNETTYQCVVDANGDRVNVWGARQLCANDPETLDREKKMFEAMMAHLRDTDSQHQTVVAIQIGSEPGISNITRCHCPVCNNLYGKGGFTDSQQFYAWSIANHIEELAKASRAIYDIPFNINTWSVGNQYYADPYKYRQLYLDTAPHIDLNGWDGYKTSISGLRSGLNNYVYGRNIIYVAETTSDRTKTAEFFIYHVLGEFGGIGQSAWSVSMSYPNTGAPSYKQGSQAGIELGRAYKAINDAMALIATYQTTDKLAWFVPGSTAIFTKTVNDLTLNISTASEQGKGIIIQPVEGSMDFTLVGNDYMVDLPDLVVGTPIMAENGRWDGKVWIPAGNVTFYRSGGKVTVTMPESCTIRVYVQDDSTDLILPQPPRNLQITQK